MFLFPLEHFVDCPQESQFDEEMNHEGKFDCPPPCPPCETCPLNEDYSQIHVNQEDVKEPEEVHVYFKILNKYLFQRTFLLLFADPTPSMDI